MQNGTVTPDHLVDTKGKSPNYKFQLYHLLNDPGEAKELFTALKADIARGRSH